MKPDPFFITGPALISFSGGRTSAYMLWRILQAHGGTLPADVVVSFANTGKELPETLRFVHECATRWGVDVVWVERTPGGGYRRVGFNSASRQGEPFKDLIGEKGYAPNRGAQFCSIELKGRVLRELARDLGFPNGYSSVLGLRHDEGLRVLKALARNDSKKDAWRNVMPLASAKVTRRDVLTFWLGPSLRMEAGERPQGFDLGLMDYQGNCDLCWKKSETKIMRVIRDNPAVAGWWIDIERETQSAFRTPSLTELSVAVAMQPMLPGLVDDDDHDVACDLLCDEGEA